MIFHQQKISGLYLIKPEAHQDFRGLYRRHFCQHEFKAHGLNIKVAQANITESLKAYTLRGFHYQKAPFAENKTLSVLRGSIYDIVVDLRPKSKTYLEWLGFKLSQRNRNALYIPEGCAHAILTLEDDTLIHYYTSQFYAPGHEAGVRYNDPSFKFKWPHQPKIVSTKDQSFPDYIVEKT